MKTIGLIGGMSWESTVTYYKVINEAVRDTQGGLHSAKILLHSVDFDEIERCQALGDWDRSADILSTAAVGLEGAGADFIVICTNTMHRVAGRIAKSVRIPLLHIADATADALESKGVGCVALLGTMYTMTGDFYISRLISRGLSVLVPDKEDIQLVNRVIYEELCLGKIRDDSRREFVRIIGQLRDRGAGGVILGCTEIGLLIGDKDSPLPVFDTTLIHAKAAAVAAMKP